MGGEGDSDAAPELSGYWGDYGYIPQIVAELSSEQQFQLGLVMFVGTALVRRSRGLV